MKRILSLIILVLTLLAVTSCRTAKAPQVITKTNIVTNTVEVHDTVAKTVPDSALLNALLRCDSLGNVYLDQLIQVSGRATTQSVTLKDNKLTVDCKVDSMAVYVKMSKVFKTSSDTTYIQSPPVKIEVEKPLSWWDKTVRISGYIMLISLGLTIAYVIFQLRGYLTKI